MVQEVAVLLRVEDLEQGGRGVATEIGAQLVDLVEHQDRVPGAALAQPLDDAPRKGADVSPPVAAELRLVAHASQRQAVESAAHGAGDRAPERGLAGARGADEAEDRGARPDLVPLELAHRQELQDAVFHLLQIVVILVQDAARLGQVDLVLALLRPGQRDQPVEVGADHHLLGRPRRDGPQPLQLAVRDFAHRRGHAGLLDLLLQALQLGVGLVVRPQLLLDRLELLAQDVLALALLELVLHLLLDLRAHLEDFDLPADVRRQLAQALLDRQRLEQLLLAGRGHVRQARRVGGVEQRHAQLVGGDRHQGEHLLDLGEQVLGERLQLDRRLRHLGQHFHVGHEVRIGLHRARHADALQAVDQDPDRAVGELEQPADHRRGPHPVQVLVLWVLDRRVLLGHQTDDAMAHHHLVDELQRVGPPDRQRHRHGGEDYGVLEGQDRQRRGDGRSLAVVAAARGADRGRGHFVQVDLRVAVLLGHQRPSTGTSRPPAGPRCSVMRRKPSAYAALIASGSTSCGRTRMRSNGP